MGQDRGLSAFSASRSLGREPSRGDPHACRSGHRALVDRLYRRHARELTRRLAKTFGSGPPEPDDIVQRVFAKLASHPYLDHVENHPAYLWRMARNAMLSELQARKRQQALTNSVDHDFFEAGCYDLDPERVIRGKEALSAANDALRRMPRQRRRAFILVRIDGLAHADAAARLGVSRPAISSYVAKATLELIAAVDGASTE